MSERSKRALRPPNRRLYEARLGIGVTQKELAIKLGELDGGIEVSSNTVSRWEQGEIPQPAHRRALCELFQKTEEELGISPLQTISEEEGRFAATLPIIDNRSLLIGRDSDLNDLRDRLFAGGITPLAGIPGVGKTTIAMQLAYDPALWDFFRGNILWYTCGENCTSDDILTEWAKLLGFSPQRIAKLRSKLTEALRAAFGTQKLCLFLDDVWDLALARTLLQVLPVGSSALVTTRFPLVGSGLAGCEFHSLGELGEVEGLYLLRLLAPRAVEADPDKALDIVRMVGGLPYALTLLGHYLASESWSVKARVTDTLELLCAKSYNLLDLDFPIEQLGLPKRQARSLREVIALSEKRLCEQERAALYALSIFPPKPHQISETAACAVANCSRKTLDRLQDFGLLEGTGEGYHMHQTLHLYSSYQLTRDQRRAACERIIAYALEIDSTQDQTEHIEIQPMLLALDATIEFSMKRELIQLALKLCPLLLAQARLGTAQKYLQQAVEATRTESEPPKEMARLLLLLGETYLRTDFHGTLDVYQEALDLARSTGDNESCCDSLATLAWHSHLFGAYEQADTYLKEGLKLALEQGLAPQIWQLLRIRGSQYWAKGDYARSEDDYQQALKLLPLVDERARQDLSMFYCFLAVLKGEQGHYDLAEDYFQQSLEAGEANGSRDFNAFVIARRAMMRLMCHPNDALRSELEQACILAHESFSYYVYVLKALAQLELALGKLEPAEQAARQALQISEAAQNKTRLGEYHTLLAQIALARGDINLAAREIEQGVLPYFRTYGTAEDRAIALVTWGELEIKRDNTNAAAAAFQEMLQTGPNEFFAVVAQSHYGLARVAAARRQWRIARREGELSLQMLERLSHTRAAEVRAWLEHLPFSFLQFFL